MAPLWLARDVILTVHDEQLAEHGGAGGIRDAGLLESALARPQNLFAYGDPDLADPAAAYAFAIVKNHPFVDGNKRTGFVAAELFLALNGYDLAADDQACVLTMLALAAGELEEGALSAWVRAHLQPRG